MVKAQDKGTLIIIGGNEQKQDLGGQSILVRVARETCGKRGSLVILTVATEFPAEVAETYRAAFLALGLERVGVLDVRCREEAFDPNRLAMLEDASVLFFTGGDQLRITSQLGGSPLLEKILGLYQRGATIVGTSAGAAVMSETMLIAGAGNASQIAGLATAPGLGLLHGVVIDSHFSQRGRFGRLLATIAKNPLNLGLGIDEDTALIAEKDQLRVLGDGAVYVFDGNTSRYTNFSGLRAQRVPTIHGLTVHVLVEGDRFDLASRWPLLPERTEERRPSPDVPSALCACADTPEVQRRES